MVSGRRSSRNLDCDWLERDCAAGVKVLSDFGRTNDATLSAIPRLVRLSARDGDWTATATRPFVGGCTAGQVCGDLRRGPM
jgi:hypothetical protein